MQDKPKVVKVEPSAHRKAKIKATEQGKSLQDYVTELIEKDTEKKKKKTTEQDDKTE